MQDLTIRLLVGWYQKRTNEKLLLLMYIALNQGDHFRRKKRLK